MAKSNRYKRLFSNTLILGLGTFGSKILTILLTRLYTSYLTTGEFGVLDLVIQSVNLLIPIVSLGMNTAVLRFAMDGETDRKSVLSTGLAIDLLGFAGLLLFWPLLSRAPGIGDYTVWMYLYILCSMLHYLFAYFVKTLQKVRLFAVANIIGTAITLLLDILFIAILKMGVIGYILAIAISDVVCIIILIFAAQLYKYIRFDAIRKKITSAMLRYSIPLIPTTIMWWITDAMDRFMVSEMISPEANGLYAASYKVPNLLILISGVFMDAWQMSVLTEKSRLERQTFFSRVFSMYQSLIFVCGSGLILCAKLVTRILVADEFYASWQYMPVLVIATALSCFVSYLGTVYVVEKKSKSTLFTTLIGTIVNVIGNYILIRYMGVQGAAISTAFSYAVVLLIRAIHTRRWIPIDWCLPRFIANSGLILAQCCLMIKEVPGWLYWQLGLFLCIAACNGKPLLQSVKAIFSRKKEA